MDNQTATPNPTPTPENIPVQNPVGETPPSQVYTAPQPPPPSPKSFLSNKIILLIVILLILLGLGGTYLALNSKPKQNPKITPAPSPTEASAKAGTPTPNPTASWKTYTNTKFRYSIQYLSKLKLIVNSDRPSITNNNNDTKHYFNISIDVSDNIKNQTTQDFVNTSKILTASGEYENPFATPKPYANGDINGIIADVTNGDDFYVEVIQAKDGKIYEFKLLSGPDTGTKPTDEDRNIFDQILSTFQFSN